MLKSAIELARILGVVGGLVVIVSSFLPPFGAFSILGTIGGLIVIYFSRRIRHLLWALVVLILGILAYEFGPDHFLNLGPILVIMAGIVAVAARIL
jgi:hypothetical protein